MNAAAAFLELRLEAIAASLARRSDALALLALGSVGRERERIDVWSDLDFFVLVAPGAKPRYVAELDWLAEAHPLAWHFANTVDGHKALMADGVFCEFAVFELDELPGIPYAPGRFVWRRPEVDEALAESRQRLPAPRARAWLVGEALSNLIVGLQRLARGERLAAMRMVQVYALDRVLELIDGERGIVGGPLRDPFGPERRAEARLGGEAASLARWAPGYAGTADAALALLAEIERRESVPAAVAERIRALAQHGSA